jgi:hypothetical protein
MVMRAAILVRTRPAVGDRAGLPEVVARLESEKARLDRHEGDMVGAWFRLGRPLAELRRLAGRDWAKRLQGLGIHSRVASRYVRLAGSELARSGLLESDLLGRVPSDLTTLGWLCRLTAGQVRDLSSRIDLKAAGRGTVIAAVKAILHGGEVPARPAPDVAAVVERAIRRLDGVLERLRDEGAGPEQRRRVRDLVVGGLRRVERALATSDGQEPTAGGGER